MAHEHHSSGEDIVIHKVTPRERGRLEIVSRAIGPDGRIADIYSAYHDNISPPLEWTRMLDAESFALVVQDPDAPREAPFVHWMIWNIPGDRTGLPQNLPTEPVLGELGGAVQGRNSVGGFGYFGPRPPAGHGVHRYHFQLFALDKVLPMEPSTPLEELQNALKRDSIAAADLVGTYELREPH
jgi:Raf kinase inhibitor-like YbhB/YbcL family protein